MMCGVKDYGYVKDAVRMVSRRVSLFERGWIRRKSRWCALESGEGER